MNKLGAFMAGAVVGPVVLVSWSWWVIGPERRAENVQKFKDAKASEKAKHNRSSEKCPDEVVEDNWIAEITYSRANDEQFVGWMKYYWIGCTPDNVRRIMKELGITHGTTMVRHIHDGRIGMKQSRWWSEPGQSGISGDIQ